jgi:electron transfer flavoprotein beta subunit
MIVACLKWTVRPGAPDDDRFAGVSAADQAALETALRLGAARNEPVVAVAAGPVGAEVALRMALACGAARAVRVDLASDADSRDVSAALAEVAAGATVVLCGDYSLDRGSGSVPAFIAHHLGAAQALGLVAVGDASDAGSTGNRVHATRRLDGGRREVLAVPFPAVLSVEGSVASLRRAGLKDSLTAQRVGIEVVAGTAAHQATPSQAAPFRPRARQMPAPAGDDPLSRLRTLTDATGAPSRGEVVEASAEAGAARIVAALREWGYLA